MATASNNPALQLSARHERTQNLLGWHHRRIVAQFMHEQYDTSMTDNDTCGVFLSGGIDSGSFIFSLIEDCHKKIHNAYTAVIEKPDGNGFIESADYRRAKAICDYYKINHHAVVIRRNPDEVCNSMLDIARNYSSSDTALSSRSDFEVMVMYFACIEEAKKQGDKIVFSGLLDGSIHMSSRKDSVPNKTKETAFGHYRMTIATMNNLSIVPAQYNVIQQKSRENGISLFMSHMHIAAQYPYVYLPWKMLNRPRDKWISILAYTEEYEKATGSPYPKTMAMQTGDSGAREFFDEMVAKSTIPEQVHEKMYKHNPKRKLPKSGITTSKVWTNLLAKLARANVNSSNEETGFPYLEEMPVLDEYWEDYDEVVKDAELSDYMEETYGGSDARLRWLEYLTCGGPKPKTKFQIDEKTGLADLDAYMSDDHFNPILSINKPSSRENVYAKDDEDGADDRVDCFGSPLHRGGAFSNIMCPRAKAGLCGKRTTECDEDKPELHKCTVLDNWGAAVSRTIWDVPSSTENAKEIDRDWSASSNEVLHALKTGFAKFIRDKENFFK